MHLNLFGFCVDVLGCELYHKNFVLERTDADSALDQMVIWDDLLGSQVETEDQVFVCNVAAKKFLFIRDLVEPVNLDYKKVFDGLEVVGRVAQQTLTN